MVFDGLQNFVSRKLHKGAPENKVDIGRFAGHLKKMSQHRITEVLIGCVNPRLKCTLITDDDDVGLGPCYCGIEEVPSQHELMGPCDRNYNSRILGSL